MRKVRYPTEVITDKALVLVLMELSARRNPDANIGDRLKCMKLPFLAANTMFEQKAKGFNLRFFRHHRGPFSKDVYSAWNHLVSLGLLVEDRQGLKITPNGSALALAISNDILSKQSNACFKGVIKDVALRYAHLTTQQIIRIIYDMEVSLPRSGTRAKVSDITLGEDMIMVLDEGEASSVLDIEPAWLETLAIELSPMNKEGLIKAFADYKEGRILSHEEVWHNVPS